MSPFLRFSREGVYVGRTRTDTNKDPGTGRVSVERGRLRWRRYIMCNCLACPLSYLLLFTDVSSEVTHWGSG